MKFQGITRFISVSLVALLVQAIGAGVVGADSSVQWAGGAAERGLVPSRDLRWSKPKVEGAQIVGVAPVQAEPTEPTRIRQVQYSVAQATPMTPAQRDTVFPELRPQTVTPPSGATLTPTVPTNPPSSFAHPFDPPTPPSQSSQQKKDSSNGSSSGTVTPPVTMPTPPAKKVQPKVDPTTFPKPESKAVELKTPDLKTDIPKTEGTLSTGTAPLPEAPDSYPTARRGERKCPDKTGFKSIREITYDIRPMPGTLPTECPLVTTPYNGRHFSQTCFQWKASALCTKAAYFEDVQLERYGHSICPFLEPVISGTRFFLTVPMLPYKMGLTPPNECVYTLGHYRVGSCAPYMLDPLPISVRAILFEGAAIGGAVAIIP